MALTAASVPATAKDFAIDHCSIETPDDWKQGGSNIKGPGQATGLMMKSQTTSADSAVEVEMALGGKRVVDTKALVVVKRAGSGFRYFVVTRGGPPVCLAELTVDDATTGLKIANSLKRK